MHLIYAAPAKTQGSADSAVLVAAMKGMEWESARGPMAIDPVTRDVVHNIYVGRVEKIAGVLTNREFAAKVADRQQSARRREFA